MVNACLFVGDWRLNLPISPRTYAFCFCYYTGLGDPLADKLEVIKIKKIQLGRTIALTVVFTIMIVIISAILIFLIPKVEFQISPFIGNFPTYAKWINEVVIPWLTGNRINLHPVAVMFAVLSGGKLFGFLGILLALPVASVIMVLLRHIHEIYHDNTFYSAEKKMIYRLVLVLVINCFIVNSWASNELQELEYAEEIEASYSTGKIIWLQANGRKFLTLYTETEQLTNKGTAIILHPMNGRPDQEKLINPLRTYLPEHNWATLSIQLPILGVDAKEQEYYPLFDDAQARIQAGIDYLVSAKVNNIVLIGYGLGGTMAIYYLKKNSNKKNVKAIVAISLSIPKTEYKQIQIIDFISQMKQPFLDIFAEYDLPAVTDSARKRRIAGKASSTYRQFQIEGEGHLFQHDEGLVVKRVYSWINRTFRVFQRQ